MIRYVRSQHLSALGTQHISLNTGYIHYLLNLVFVEKARFLFSRNTFSRARDHNGTWCKTNKEDHFCILNEIGKKKQHSEIRKEQ